MYSVRIKTFAVNLIDKLPKWLQYILFRSATEIRFLKFAIAFRIKPKPLIYRYVPNPSKIYFVSPKRIIYHTNFLKEDSNQKRSFGRRVLPPEMRGKVVGGSWDITNRKFADLNIYKAFEKRIQENVEWQETDFYKSVFQAVKKGQSPWNIRNINDLDNRCKYLDLLITNIRKNGYRLNRNTVDKNFAFDEIEVNIGRKGQFLFQNGAHRLSIAKILGVEQVPVMIFARHKKWQDFKQFVFSYATQQKTGRLYQPAVHPDLAELPYDCAVHNCQDLMEVFKNNLTVKRGAMLDIGANIGFFCHKFEDLGYKCYAVERDPVVFKILRKIKIAEKKQFNVINKSIFDLKFVKNMKFDVVLALNIFHHFLKTKTDFIKLKRLLGDLEMNQMFFEPHQYEDSQMRNAWINFDETSFVAFILGHTSLKNSQVIYESKDGRKVFKLSK